MCPAFTAQLWVVSTPLVGEQIGWGRSVRLQGLVMAQTRVQSPGFPQTARGGGRKERLGVAESWEKGRWAGPGEKRRKLAPTSSGEESCGKMATGPGTNYKGERALGGWAGRVGGGGDGDQGQAGQVRGTSPSTLAGRGSGAVPLPPGVRRGHRGRGLRRWGSGASGGSRAARR